MGSEFIKCEREGNIATVVIDRPDKRNAMNVEMVMAMKEHFEEIATDTEIRSIIIHGAGDCFSSGIDFMELAGFQSDMARSDVLRRFIAGHQAVMNTLEAIDKPVIAALHGYVYGMGLELALAADFRIAAAGTSLAIQEVELGLIPDVGGTTRLTRTVGIVKAKELILTAKKIDAQEALSIQLVNEVVDPGSHLDAARRLAEVVNRNAPLAVGIAKRIIDRGAHMDKHSFMELEALGQSTLFTTEDVMEGVMAKVQKRSPEFKGK